MKRLRRNLLLVAAAFAVVLACAACGSTETTLATAEPGDVIKYGQYYVNSGTEVEDLEWIVLANEDDRLFLLTKDIIAYWPYAYPEDTIEYTDPTEPWKHSAIRDVLNSQEFLDLVFSEEEQAAIETVPFGDGVNCKVFLLGQSECLAYDPGQYGAAEFTYNADNLRKQYYETEYGKLEQVLDEKIGTTWVLRETASDNPRAAVVMTQDGSATSGLVDANGNPTIPLSITGYQGVRPAIIVQVP